MKFISGLTLTIIFLFFGNFFFAQSSQSDSLIKKLKYLPADTQKAVLYNDIAIRLKRNDPQTALKYVVEGIELAKKLNSQKCLFALYNTKSIIFRDIGDFDKAILIAEEAMNIAVKLNDKRLFCVANNSLGSLYTITSKYKKAQVHYLNFLKMAESMNDMSMISKATGNLANLFLTQKNYKDALGYNLKSISIKEKLGNLDQTAGTYNNIGLCYHYLHDLENSYKYHLKALDNYNKTQNKTGLAVTYNHLGYYFLEKKGYLKSLEYQKRALNLQEELQDSVGMFYSFGNIAKAYVEMKDYPQAIKWGKKAEATALSLNVLYEMSEVCSVLYEIFEKSGDYKTALLYHKKLRQVSDSLLNEQNNKILIETQTKFETEKKEKEIVILNKDKLLKNKEIKEHKTVQNYLFIVIALVILFLGFVFRAFKQKQKANTIITQQKLEVEKAKDLVEIQKEIVEEKQTEILDSIHYAQRIQRALLAGENMLNENLNGSANNFVLFKPKDIVSGDFYWATSVSGSRLGVSGSMLQVPDSVDVKQEQEMTRLNSSSGASLATSNQEYFYLAVCDSTGHGVPGAFMSLLSIGFLSEAIKEKKIHEPNKVFDYVRKRLVESISAEGQKDGFDGILLCVNRTTKQITYAAANNSPVIISPNGLQYLPVDKMPVGQCEKMEGFRLHTVNYNSGDILYLFTDGFADQFGGPKGKKFKYKQLEDILLANSTLSLSQQSSVLDQRFTDWKGKLEQVDDVLIIGLRL